MSEKRQKYTVINGAIENAIENNLKNKNNS